MPLTSGVKIKQLSVQPSINDFVETLDYGYDKIVLSYHLLFKM